MAPRTGQDRAEFGIVVFAGLLLSGWWLARSRDSRTMAAALVVPISTVLAVAINQPLIRAVGEVRPFVTYPDALVLVKRSTDAGFPSDHATMAGAVATGLFLVSRRLGLVAGGCAVLMALARVYVGVHYPRDVLAGLLVGSAVALICWLILAGPVTCLVGRVREGPRWQLLASARQSPIAALEPDGSHALDSDTQLREEGAGMGRHP